MGEHKLPLNIECRLANQGDFEELVELHLRNFDENELSVMLGPKLVRTFYRQVLADENVFCHVVVREGLLAAFSLLFTNYSHFERSIKWKSAGCLVEFVAANTLRLRPRLIYRAARNALSKNIKPLIPKEIYNCHVGSIVIDKIYRRDVGVIRAFRNIFNENVALGYRLHQGAWTSIRLSNRGSLKFAASAGLNTELVVKSYPEDLVILYVVNPPSRDKGSN